MFENQTLLLFLRRSHIVVGIVGVVVFWVPVFARKGGRLHILAGRIFEWTGYYVASTALLTCARYLLTPHHFAFVARPGETAEELARVEFAQFFLTLLSFLAWTVLSQLRTGMRVVRTRRLPAEGYRNWESRFWLYSLPAASLWLVSFGAYRLATGGSSVHWISVVVGMIPLLEFKKERAFFQDPRQEKMSWWYKHMECMLGCGVAFHTAGLVFAFRWMSTNDVLTLPGAWQMVPWILPSLIGVPAAYLWVRHYRRKFGDARLPKPPIASAPLGQTD